MADVVALQHVADIERLLLALDECASVASDAPDAHQVVEAIEAARRSMSTVLDIWRAAEVRIVGTVAASDDARTELKVVAKPKYRFDHTKIGFNVARAATLDENGEAVFSPFEAATRAVEFMLKLYVAPAAKPTNEGLASIGITEPLSMTLKREEGTPRVQERPKR